MNRFDRIAFAIRTQIKDLGGILAAAMGVIAYALKASGRALARVDLNINHLGIHGKGLAIRNAVERKRGKAHLVDKARSIERNDAHAANRRIKLKVKLSRPAGGGRQADRIGRKCSRQQVAHREHQLHAATKQRGAVKRHTKHQRRLHNA